jgi:hypothetical protein
VFTARYAPSPYIKHVSSVFKGLRNITWWYGGMQFWRGQKWEARFQLPALSLLPVAYTPVSLRAGLCSAKRRDGPSAAYFWKPTLHPLSYIPERIHYTIWLCLARIAKAVVWCLSSLYFCTANMRVSTSSLTSWSVIVAPLCNASSSRSRDAFLLFWPIKLEDSRYKFLISRIW